MAPNIEVAANAADASPRAGFETGSEIVTVIAPSRGMISLDLKELWTYRELLYFLTWRDIKVRYKQTALGAAWAVIQPVMTMVIFTLVFGTLAKIPSDGLPYPVFTFVALLPWQLFAYALTSSSNSVVASQNLITKIYFPRLIIPLSSVLSGMVDFAIAFVVLIGLLAWYGIVPGLAIFTLPLFVVFATLAALAVGLWLSALNVEFRDVRHVIPFLVQVWMFATPIAYPASLVPERWRAVYAMNPMVGVVEGFRWALLGTGHLDRAALAVSFVMVVGLLITGAYYFRRVETTLADVV
jgi:lipopolysaccharide transport system permease protein